MHNTIHHIVLFVKRRKRKKRAKVRFLLAYYQPAISVYGIYLSIGVIFRYRNVKIILFVNYISFKLAGDGVVCYFFLL